MEARNFLKKEKKTTDCSAKKVFNKSLTLKIFPDSWKDANVLPIHKKKKSVPQNRTIIGQYHYSASDSVVGNLIERCLHKHLFCYLLCFRHLSESRFWLGLYTEEVNFQTFVMT